jgi:hypothetical protein
MLNYDEPLSNFAFKFNLRRYSLCNDSSLTYSGDKHVYEKIGESTEVALRAGAYTRPLFSST